jgi:antitoxin (DNA-binding transcriptional repressor) of toxin-antitoxin stability system
MKTMNVGELKENFTKMLDIINQGEEITISSGNKKKKYIAVLVPFNKYTGKHKRQLGILEKKASFSLKKDFKITDEELLSL